MSKHYQNSYTARLAELTSRGMAEAVKEGRDVGVIPLGFKRYYGEATRPSTVPTDQAPLITAAFCLVAAGRSVREALRVMHILGLTGRNGKPISVSTLHHVLINPFYSGLLRYKGELFQGNHQALVTPELFARVQKSLELRRTTTEG